jgi:hypothetical protein
VTPKGLRDRYEARIARARDAVGAARDRAAEAAQSTRRTAELAAGAGSLLGAMLGGRRSARTIARDVGRAISGRSRSDQAARRVQTAENRAQDRQEALADLEADLAQALTAIDDEWSAKAAAVETVDVSVEKSDLMAKVLHPLGTELTTRPVRPAHPGRTAGFAFEMYYVMGNLTPHREPAWALLAERARILAHRCRQVDADHDDAHQGAISDIAEQAQTVADSLTADVPEALLPPADQDTPS